MLFLQKNNYGHKRAYNKFVGPEGGTRRLHHLSIFIFYHDKNRYGDEIG